MKVRNTKDQWDLNLREEHDGHFVTFFMNYSNKKICEMLKSKNYTTSQINHVIRTTNKYQKHCKNPKGTIYGGSLEGVDKILRGIK